MRRIITAAATAGIVLSAAAGARPAQAGTVTAVPCSAATLASAISGAADGATLSLAPHCTYVLPAALPPVSQDLTIRGNDATLQRSTASGTPSFTILTLTAGNVTLDQLSFRNGTGAISVSGMAALTVNDGTFAGNSAANGGAIDVNGYNGPVITDAVFIGNSATESGGAIYDNAANNGAYVSGSKFTGNTAGQGGGAISEYSLGGEMDSSTFRGNSAGDIGGAIAFSTLGEIFSGDSIRNNITGGDGGGIYDYESDTGMDVSGSTISDNRAAGDGGGIWLTAVGSWDNSVTGSTLRGNSGTDGGAIFAAANNGLALSGDDIVNNHASADGGGLYEDGGTDTASQLSIGTTTFFANRAAGHGGGIFNRTSPVPVTDSAITGNLAGGGGGGIYDDVTAGASVTLTSTPVTRNHPDNCEPAGSIPGCAG
jgi:predicted outer membrane repeat protein